MTRRRTREPPKKRSPKKADPFALDVLGWLRDKRLGQNATYVRQGRKYSDLSDVALFSAWTNAFRAMAETLSDNARLEEQYLFGEIELRKLEPPFNLVMDAFKLLRAKIKEGYERSKSDPEKFRESGKQIAQDLAEFLVKRDQPKN
jgi:hypothetical protein